MEKKDTAFDILMLTFVVIFVIFGIKSIFEFLM